MIMLIITAAIHKYINSPFKLYDTMCIIIWISWKSDIEPKNSCSGSEDTGKEACEIAKSLDKKFVVFTV